MKNMILFLTTLLLVSFTSDGKLKWYSWNEGYELAKKENKPLLIFIQASWCDKCKRMNEKTFPSPEVRQIIEKSYIPVRYDVEADLKKDSGYICDGKNLSGKAVLKMFVSGPQLRIPLTILWVPGSEKKVSIEGILDPSEMEQKLTQNLR